MNIKDITDYASLHFDLHCNLKTLGQWADFGVGTRAWLLYRPRSYVTDDIIEPWKLCKSVVSPGLQGAQPFPVNSLI